MTPREARQTLNRLYQCIGDHRENYAALHRFIDEVEAIRNGRDVADQPAPTETAPPSAVAWAQGYLQSTNDGYSGRTSPNPYRAGWQGSDGESEDEPAPTETALRAPTTSEGSRVRVNMPGSDNHGAKGHIVMFTDNDIGAPWRVGFDDTERNDGDVWFTADELILLPRLAHALANPPGPRHARLVGCCVVCGGKSHAGPCVHMRPAPLAREALASARLDVETHCLPEVEGPRGAREATAGWPVEEPGVLQRLRAEPQGAPHRFEPPDSYGVRFCRDCGVNAACAASAVCHAEAEPQGAPDELCAGVVEVGRGYRVLCELPPGHDGPHSSEVVSQPNKGSV